MFTKINLTLIDLSLQSHNRTSLAAIGKRRLLHVLPYPMYLHLVRAAVDGWYGWACSALAYVHLWEQPSPRVAGSQKTAPERFEGNGIVSNWK
jgi:hypothetical protein